MKEMSKNYSLEEREMAVPPVGANPPTQKMGKQRLDDHLARILFKHDDLKNSHPGVHDPYSEC